MKWTPTYTLPTLPRDRPRENAPLHHHRDWCARYNAAVRLRGVLVESARASYEAAKHALDAEVQS